MPMASPSDSPPSSDPPVSDDERLVDGVSVGGQVYATSQLETGFYGMVTQLVPQYGWYLLLGLVLLVLAWIQLRSRVYAWLQRRSEQMEERNFDPVKAEKYQDAMLQARERMQRVQDEKAVEHQDKKTEQEDKERDERIHQWETFRVVSKSKKHNPGKGGTGRFPSTREYFPLGGGGGGGGYRPSRRTVGGGG